MKMSLATWTKELAAIQESTKLAPLGHLPSHLDKFRGWAIKQKSLKRRGKASSAPLAYVPAPPPVPAPEPVLCHA